MVVVRVSSTLTGRMKILTLPRWVKVVASLWSVALLSGCFETTQEFTLNPDGSGKVVHECRFQEFNLMGESGSPEEALEGAVRRVLRESKGVEAWSDVAYRVLDDGHLYFKGTAYFTNLSEVDIPNQTMLEFNWERTADQAVLLLRTDDGEAGTIEAETEAVDVDALSPEEREKRIRAERAKFQQAKGMMAGVFEGMKHDVTFHLPGAAQTVSNFKQESTGNVSLQFEGAKLLAALETLVNDDDWVGENIGALGGRERPALDEPVNALVFGERAPVEVEVALSGLPLFDYAAEVGVAKEGMEALREALGLGSVTVTIAPPAKGEPLRGVRVVGARLVRDTGHDDTDFRPFNYDPGYTVVLQVDLPGSILDLTDESRLTVATADDETSLLPSSEWDRSIRFPKLSKDKASALIELNLTAPGPSVRGVKVLAGQLEYQVANRTREIDLGFSELTAGGRGKELGAQIQSFKEGWGNDGSQQMELKLDLPEAVLKSVSLVVDGKTTELERQGYFGGGNSYTFTLAHKTAFPSNGRVVVEIYDDLQTFITPFKLENLSLLGHEMNLR